MHCPSALFLGLITVDMLYDLPAFPLPNTKARATSFRLDSGGPAFNAAATFTHLGGTAQLFTSVGQHAFTGFLLSEISRYHLALHDLDPESEGITLSSVLNTPEGSRTIITHRQDAHPVTPDWDLVGIDLVLVDGFHLPVAIDLAEKCREKGIPVVLDGGSWKTGMEYLLPLVDIAICSSDFRLPEGGLPEWEFFREKGAKGLAVTHGEAPVAFWSQEESGVVEVPSVTVADTLGAGDIFHGAFCWYFAQNKSLKQGLEAAATVAANACSYPGAKTWMHPPVV